MGQSLQNLVDIHNLEELDKGLFRGQSVDLGFGHVFGGQVMGQALAAASRTVANDRKVHSFHSYFLLPGDEHAPIIYNVEILRDGGSFSSRRVKAVQKGRPIFYMTCSFQSEEAGFEHQSPMPNVPAPEGLLNQQQLAQGLIGKVPEKVLQHFLKDSPIEMRLVSPQNPLSDKPQSPIKQVWLRANGNLAEECDLHRSLLAYASDFNFLVASIQPHPISFLTPGLKMATIDHAMWFHRPIKFDEWLLYHVESTSATGGRGFVKGQFFDIEGKLVASTTQEGLIRFPQQEQV
ncbi:acyl-CoA thioesterase II [Paraferrimonas sp. SM1919]|uniref:acyl-CoA thioesterase II n=1 Tax=Paraferrimonas sp. SM1919 TaxID=2662263 RepID=UPI0013D04233|nr:acyl-CoA thioesterase II [Paraferrimonas sp. SM1919]